jgi:hypothetical protein
VRQLMAEPSHMMPWRGPVEFPKTFKENQDQIWNHEDSPIEIPETKVITNKRENRIISLITRELTVMRGWSMNIYIDESRNYSARDVNKTASIIKSTSTTHWNCREKMEERASISSELIIR